MQYNHLALPVPWDMIVDSEQQISVAISNHVATSLDHAIYETPMKALPSFHPAQDQIDRACPDALICLSVHQTMASRIEWEMGSRSRRAS